jgi:hypothetical protein
MVEFADSSFIPRGQLLTSVLISRLWVSFLVVTYAGLIVTMPRAGWRPHLAEPFVERRPWVCGVQHRLMVHPVALGTYLWDDPF